MMTLDKWKNLGMVLLFSAAQFIISTMGDGADEEPKKKKAPRKSKKDGGK